MKKTKLFHSLSIFAALILLIWQLIPSMEVEQEKTQTLVADWFGIDIAVIEMDEQGKPKRSFTAERLTHYAAQKMTDLDAPSFTMIPDTNIPWRLTADKGRSFHSARTTDIARIDLWNNVSVWQPKEATKTPMRMNTSTLAIFPDKAFAQTDQLVEFEQPGHKLKGKGMRAKFNEQSMELLDKVRSEHVRQPLS